MVGIEKRVLPSGSAVVLVPAMYLQPRYRYSGVPSGKGGDAKEKTKRRPRKLPAPGRKSRLLGPKWIVKVGYLCLSSVKERSRDRPNLSYLSTRAAMLCARAATAFLMCGRLTCGGGVKSLLHHMRARVCLIAQVYEHAVYAHYSMT